jgi:exonuclease III
MLKNKLISNRKQKKSNINKPPPNTLCFVNNSLTQKLNATLIPSLLLKQQLHTLLIIQIPCKPTIQPYLDLRITILLIKLLLKQANKRKNTKTRYFTRKLLHNTYLLTNKSLLLTVKSLEITILISVNLKLLIRNILSQPFLLVALGLSTLPISNASLNLYHINIGRPLLNPDTLETIKSISNKYDIVAITEPQILEEDIPYIRKKFPDKLIIATAHKRETNNKKYILKKTRKLQKITGWKGDQNNILINTNQAKKKAGIVIIINRNTEYRILQNYIRFDKEEARYIIIPIRIDPETIFITSFFYAPPSGDKENNKFWKKLGKELFKIRKTEWAKTTKNINIITGGDSNAKLDNQDKKIQKQSSNKYHGIKNFMLKQNVIDIHTTNISIGLRDVREFTYCKGGEFNLDDKQQSRIDRWLISPQLAEQCCENTLPYDPLTSTDHRAITLELLDIESENLKFDRTFEPRYKTEGLTVKMIKNKLKKAEQTINRNFMDLLSNWELTKKSSQEKYGDFISFITQLANSALPITKTKEKGEREEFVNDWTYKNLQKTRA